MKHQCILPIIFLLFSWSQLNAQIGIGIDSVHSSALLDLNSTDKGLLIPRTDTLSISNPADGLMIYDITDKLFYYFDGSKWGAIGKKSKKQKIELNSWDMHKAPESETPNFSGYYHGLHFTNGASIDSLSAWLHDTNPGTGAPENSIKVEMRRVSKTSIALIEPIYLIETTEMTGNSEFKRFSTSDVLTPGSEIVDNEAYVYFILVFTGDDCYSRAVEICSSK